MPPDSPSAYARTIIGAPPITGFELLDVLEIALDSILGNSVVYFLSLVE